MVRQISAIFLGAKVRTLRQELVDELAKSRPRPTHEERLAQLSKVAQ